MGAKLHDEIRGLEYDWLGTDSRGQAALFSTAGGGLAPVAFLEALREHDAAIEALFAAPTTTRAAFVSSGGSGGRNDWGAAAERGLFAYDSDFFGGEYRLVASPERPAKVETLPALVRAVAEAIVIERLDFARASVIRADDLPY